MDHDIIQADGVAQVVSDIDHADTLLVGPHRQAPG
jgi:hypothetical protein